MRYKSLIQIAQVFFLVIIPKKLVYASSFGDYVYDGKDFVDADQCEEIKTTKIPFYIIKQDLTSSSTSLFKGSFVAPADSAKTSERSFKILKHPKKDPRGATGSQTIDASYAEAAPNYNMTVLQSKETPFDLDNKILRIEKSNDKITYERCCKGSQCTDYPVFTVYDKNKVQGRIAFSPSATDFITLYSVSLKTGADTPAVAPVPPTLNGTGTDATPIAIDDEEDEDVVPATSPQQKVICTQSGPLRIYDESLKTVIYKAPRYTAVKVYQDWSGGPSEKTVKGYKIVKIQLANASGKEIIGWGASDFVKPAQECRGMPLMYGGKDGEEVIPGSTVVVDSPKGSFRFPTLNPPSAGYKNGDGARFFGARRRNGKRAHAAADLLRPTGEKVLSVDGGKVLRKYAFYLGTYAIEVKQDSGYVVRYGEVAKTNINGADAGERVIKGQHIGNIGSLRMLHFEIYSDKANGPLTQMNTGKYWRRSDLMDPTPLLTKWQNDTF